MSDSPIWTNPASDDDPFAGVKKPDDMAEIAKAAREHSRLKLEPRLRRFRRGRISPERMRELAAEGLAFRRDIERRVRAMVVNPDARIR